MKRRRGCETCRQRHRKCLVPPGASVCNGCSESGRACNFEPKFKFTTHRQIYRQSHDAQQPSTAPPRFIVGTRNRQNIGPTSPEHDSDSRLPRTRDKNPRDEVSNATAPITGQHVASSPLPTSSTFPPNRSTRINTGGNSRDDGAFSPAIVNSVTSIPFMLSEYLPTPGTIRTTVPSPDGSDPHGHHRNISHPSDTQDNGQNIPPVLTQRQASLFRTYVQRLAPVADACDAARHFTTIVPRLALQEPMILNAVLAWASRYEVLCNHCDSSDLEATYYHNRCIERLIEAFDKPSETYDSTLLTAVVLSRVFEEYDPDSDSHQHHLAGTRNLLHLSAVALFVTEGGLAEAASWLHLRQAISVFIVRRKPVPIPFKSFALSTAFRHTDDGSYANRMVYLFAKLLKLFFPPGKDNTNADGYSPVTDQDHDIDTWQTLKQEVQAWSERRPPTFHPVLYESPDLASGNAFPTLWMITSTPVIGMQHYYAAKVIFSLQECHDINPNAGFLAAKTRRDNERAISDHLGSLMGLALSNPRTENAFFLPSHMLSLCGYCIQHVIERDKTIEFLHQVKHVLGWKTESLVTSLRHEWAELDKLGSQ